MSSDGFRKLSKDDQARIRLAHNEMKKLRGKDAVNKTAEIIGVLEQYQGMTESERKQFVKTWASSR